ncbi:NAD(P)/FAD-dependent oxidoreductase [Alkalicoccus chagannorensis]|uniref:NAD(P)/FAD-dependent oxidoreductase n=1 Tax=Alkalicoccus chagannorensis TaxID=427072 RepID=UPI0003FEEA58|nr:NAD(P)/FAD-dependent oxidoreductase [Alkalicoccus chagannorensis]
MFDYTIIGGGATGTFTALELAQHEGRTLLLEKGEKLSQVQTTHNSALVHPPLMVPPDKGSLKAQLAAEGNLRHHEAAEAWKLPVFRGGALLLARSDAEVGKLEKLKEEAAARGLDDVNLLTRKELFKKEPMLHPDVLAGLEMTSALTADTAALTTRAAAEAEAQGAVVKMNQEVTAIDQKGEGFRLHLASGETIDTRFLINAAGAGNVRIASMVEEEVPYEMRPHRGEYLVLGPEAKGWTSHILYPIPTKQSKGILIIPQPDGTTRLGPTSVLQKSTEDNPFTEEGEKLIRSEIERMMKFVPYQHVIRRYAGIRSTINQDDFYIQQSKEHPHFIHVAGIDSPGVTAAPAIARYVTEEVLGAITPMVRRKAAGSR